MEEICKRVFNKTKKKYTKCSICSYIFFVQKSTEIICLTDFCVKNSYFCEDCTWPFIALNLCFVMTGKGFFQDFTMRLEGDPIPHTPTLLKSNASAHTCTASPSAHKCTASPSAHKCTAFPPSVRSSIPHIYILDNTRIMILLPPLVVVRQLRHIFLQCFHYWEHVKKYVQDVPQPVVGEMCDQPPFCKNLFFIK